jgi:hypothetical protein
MTAAHKHHATIQKLKKRICALERKEIEGRKKLRSAMAEARKLARKVASVVVKMEKKNFSRLVHDISRKVSKSGVVAKVKKKIKS